MRLPEAEIESALSHGYRLMALLGAVQHQVQRRTARLDATKSREPRCHWRRTACVDILNGEPATGHGSRPKSPTAMPAPGPNIWASRT